MLYRGEVIIDNKVRKAITSQRATHPKQVVRVLVSLIPPNMAFFTIRILSEDNMFWEFAGRKVNGMVQLKNTAKEFVAVTKTTMNSVFAGNMTISEACANG